MNRLLCRKISFLVACLFLAGSSTVWGQVNIKGPLCVIPGLTYQYLFTGNAGVATQVCIKGGRLLNGDTCVSSENLSFIFLVWNDTGSHRLELTSSSGNTTISVQATTELNGGQIEDVDRERVYDTTATGYTFHCTAATGGSCQTTYIYQWQRSDNNLNWTNIEGATGVNYTFSGKLMVNTYFRRVTRETAAQAIAYSDHGLLAVVFNN